MRLSVLGYVFFEYCMLIVTILSRRNGRVNVMLGFKLLSSMYTCGMLGGCCIKTGVAVCGQIMQHGGQIPALCWVCDFSPWCVHFVCLSGIWSVSHNKVIMLLQALCIICRNLRYARRSLKKQFDYRGEKRRIWQPVDDVGSRRLGIIAVSLLPRCLRNFRSVASGASSAFSSLCPINAVTMSWRMHRQDSVSLLIFIAVY